MGSRGIKRQMRVWRSHARRAIRWQADPFFAGYWNGHRSYYAVTFPDPLQSKTLEEIADGCRET